MKPLGYVALVLHAHLPYVRHPEHARSIEERWLYEALWESYLPLLDVLDRLAADGLQANLTISVSPTLAAMLRDELLGRRFEDHLERTEALAATAEARARGTDFAAAAAAVRRRLDAARRGWAARRRDVLGALVEHAAAGQIALWTTSATHAYLPGLLPTPGSIRAQLRLGLRGFAALSGAPAPRGFWLPECAYDPRLDADLAAAGVRVTIVDAHALADGASLPVRSPAGVTYLGRDAASVRQVWSPDEGYPGHPAYREFYRDIGFDWAAEDLRGEIGPGGARLMTGIKLHRVTGPGAHKAPYEPAAAEAQARAHAADFVARRRAHLARLAAPHAGDAGAPPILVPAYDAELFGHFWLEGPVFLEHALRGLAEAGDLAAITPEAYLDRFPARVIAQPSASSWGQGGFGGVWVGRAAASLWRHVHHADRAVQAALAAAGDVDRRWSGLRVPDSPDSVRGRALDQAIRELLLLQASDWGFMIDRGDMAQYGLARASAHAERARRLAALASSVTPPATGDVAWLETVRDSDTFLVALRGADLRDAFDPLPGPQARTIP